MNSRGTKCKIGDVIYQTDGVRIYESTIRKIIYDTENVAFDESAIGESIFLTQEDAEKAKEKYQRKDYIL